MKEPPCHAGAGHGPARSYAHWGHLCDPCWAWCLWFVAKLCGSESADRLRTRHQGESAR
jgi:hypothetical protein